MALEDKQAPEAEVVANIAPIQEPKPVVETILVAPVANPLIQMAIDQAAERLAKELAQ